MKLSFFCKKKKFLKYYLQIASEIKAGKLLTPAGNKFSKSSADTYFTSAHRIRLFEKEVGPVYVEDISPEWAERFAIFLMDKGYCKNTIGGTLAKIKAVMKRLNRSGIADFDGRGIYAGQEEVTSVYSSIEDLIALTNCDLSETPGFEKVRDVYILQCFVGLRFSDLSILLPDSKRFLRDIGGKWFIEIKTKKTGEVVVIPVADIVHQILTKYNFTFEPFSFQYYNLTIKEVARKARITGDIVFSRTKGGKRVDTIFQKCDLMSSHTARRTFATNAFLSGLQERNIMMITGHKTTASFHKYIRCSSLDSAIKIANHSFFSLPLSITQLLDRSEVLILADETTYKASAISRYAYPVDSK